MRSRSRTNSRLPCRRVSGTDRAAPYRGGFRKRDGMARSFSSRRCRRISFPAVGRDDGRASYVSESREVRLSDPVGGETLVYGSDPVRIGFDLGDFAEAMERQTGTGHGQSVLYREPVKNFESAYDMTDEITDPQPDTGRVFAELLDAGKAFLCDRKKGEYSESVRIERYDRHCRYLLCRDGGKRYSLPGGGAVFFEIADRTP